MSDDDNSQLLGEFGTLINTLGGGGDRGQSFPQSDADDLTNRARFIPGEVTMARRAGAKVDFVQDCGKCCWYWKMPDGTRIYHWDPITSAAIREANGKKDDEPVGPCPHCGNENTNGSTVKP